MPCSKNFSKKKVNLDEVREYFDPHPGGLLGAGWPFPPPLRQTAQSLVGKRMTLRKVKSLFEEVLKSAQSSDVAIHERSIHISIPRWEDSRKYGGPCHSWKAICHRPVK